MMVGIDPDGAVTGVSIISNSETSGIGSKVMNNETLANGTKVLDQFIGKSAADGTLVVGTNVDAITGATVSSKGVTTGVNTALAAAGAILADVWLQPGKMPVVDSLGEEFLSYVKDGMTVTIGPNGTVTVE